MTAQQNASAARSVDAVLFRRLSIVAACMSVGILIGSAWLFPLNRLTPYSITIGVIALLGIVFALTALIRQNKSRSSTLLLYVLLLPSLELLVIAWLFPGYLVLWLLATIVLALTGRRSLLATIPLSLIFCSLNLASVSWSWSYFALSIPALAVAYLVAESSERSLQTVQLAAGLSQRLDGAQMQEQLMMNAIADAVVGVDLESRVVVFNEAAQKLTGWDAQSAYTIEYNLIFKLKDAQDGDLTPENDPFAMVLKSNKTLVTTAFSMVSKTGAKIAFSISIAPTLDSMGQVNGAIGVFHDISEQQALARERNEFISTASHEMRTPVAAIEGYVSMAMNPKLATIDEKAAGFLTKAHDSSVHLGKLFRDLLSVTKIEDNRVSIHNREFNLTELIYQVVTEMAIIAAAKGLTIETQIGGAGLGRERVIAPIFTVVADPDRIREVVANLIDNAIKYSSAGMVRVGVSEENGFVVIAVQDQGIGISVEEQKHLFQKFYRVNSSLTREIGGTGLGLYIARSLIERFGGRIWVESQEGKGSTFKFTLPLAKPEI